MTLIPVLDHLKSQQANTNIYWNANAAGPINESQSTLGVSTAVPNPILSAVSSAPSAAQGIYCIKLQTTTSGAGVTYFKRPGTTPTDDNPGALETLSPGQYKIQMDVYYSHPTGQSGCQFYTSTSDGWQNGSADGRSSIPVNEWITFEIIDTYLGPTINSNSGRFRFWIDSTFTSGNFLAFDNVRWKKI